MSDLQNKEDEFHAKALLSNPIFLACMESVHADINREMDSVKHDDLKGMQSLVLLRQASTKIISYIAESAEKTKVSDFNSSNKRKLFNRR